MVLWVLVAACLMGLLVRSFLIVLGYYKDPVLRSFEVYGSEVIYSPILGLIFWSMLAAGFAFLTIFGVSVVLVLVMLAFIPVVLIYPRFADYVRAHPSTFLMYPRWYARLMDLTSRDERRRMAYLWLRLPLRTRLLYNTHDAHFEQWADLVLMTMA